MSILAAMFATPFSSYCSSSKGLFPAFPPSQNCKREKASFFQVEQLNCQKNFSIASEEN